jgi:UDP-N-acetylglucosamine diphosphorylase/glucosamine-1-phosphate N-acetyltransferase
VRLYLFDDARADGWSPFALSRPVSELRFGCLLLRERLERFAGRDADGILTRPWLSDFDEAGAPPVVPPGRPDGDRDRLLLSSRFVPPDDARFRDPGEAAVLTAGGDAVGAWLPAGRETPDGGWTSEPGPLPGAREVEVEGRLLTAVWELVGHGPGRTARDVELLAGEGSRVAPSATPGGVWRDGDHPLHLEAGVRLEPGVFLDLREGPIWLGEGVEVRSGARLAGPLAAGAGSRLLGGPLEALSAGPVSHLRGEVSETTFLGWVNKAHAGHLGHAVVGRWANLGAETTNSDLKNNYGPVRLAGPGGDRETGMLKLGCMIGDHAKTAIGTLLPTGAAVGTGANVFGGPRAPRWVEPFSWGGGPDAPVYRKKDFLETAETVMGRRDVEFRASTRAWLGEVWEEARRRREGARRPRPAGPA